MQKKSKSLYLTQKKKEENINFGLFPIGLSQRDLVFSWLRLVQGSTTVPFFSPFWLMQPKLWQYRTCCWFFCGPGHRLIAISLLLPINLKNGVETGKASTRWLQPNSTKILPYDLASLADWPMLLSHKKLSFRTIRLIYASLVKLILINCWILRNCLLGFIILSSVCTCPREM